MFKIKKKTFKDKVNTIEKHIVLVVIIGMLLVSIVTPFILEFFVYRNEMYSVLKNEDWNSFLGSFLGSIIGGVATMIAVLITIRHANKVQENTDRQIESERKRYEVARRETFAKEVAEIVSEYITDASAYFYTHCDMDFKVEKKNRLERKIHMHEDEKKAILCKMYEHFPLVNNSEKKNLDSRIYDCIKELEKSKLEVQDLDVNLNLIEFNRTKAVNCYFLLNMKLHGVEEGKRVLEIVKEMHSFSKYSEISSVNWLGERVDELMEEVKRFIETYPSAEK